MNATSLKSVAFTVTSCYSWGILINLYFYFSSFGPVLVSAPVSTAHDFNHGLAPSSEDPPLQGMPEPSLYGLQTQSTIAGDPHCFSGSTSSTVPPLLGTPGYLSSHGMQSSSLPSMQSRSPVISEHTQNTDSPSNKSGTSP